MSIDTTHGQVDEPEADPDFVAKCEGCSKVLKRGDRGQSYTEACICFCEDCAETYGELRARIAAEPEAYDSPEEWQADLALIDKQIAAGASLDDKYVWEL